ncbi:MAG: lysostaphin resistance A-like protein [Planctomycetota bacterium]
MGWALIATAAFASGLVIHRRRFWSLAGGAGTQDSSPELALPLLTAALGIWLAQQIAGGIGVSLFGLDEQARQTLSGMAIVVASGLAGAALVIVAIALAAPAVATLAIPIKHLVRDSMRGLGSFLLVYPWVLVAGGLATGVERWMASRRGEKGPGAIAHDTLELLASPESMYSAPWWAVVLLVVVGVAIVEELIFRACLQGSMRGALVDGKGEASRDSRVRWLAIAITSILFVAVHAPVTPWHGLVPLAVLSVGLGAAYERTGTVIVPIVMHGVFNAVNVGAVVWVG